MSFYEEEKDEDAWWTERTLPEKILIGIGFGILGVLLLFLLGFLVMKLWNWLMPEIFDLKEISYWQAWGLLILSSILFKDFGGGSSSEKRTEKKRKQHLRQYMEDDRLPSQQLYRGDPVVDLENPRTEHGTKQDTGDGGNTE